MSEVAPEAVVSGTGAPVSPSAGTSNTVNEAGGPPDTIPYARFKEVNDQLQDWKRFEQVGYDPNSVGQLIQWEQSFAANPVDTWLAVAKEYQDQLPDEIAQALAAHFSDETGSEESETEAPPTPQAANNEPPAWAVPLIQKHNESEANEVQQARMDVLNKLLTDWDEQNKTDKLPEVPERIKLTFIAGSAGTAGSAEEILKNAREEWLMTRQLAQGEVVRPPGSGGPRPVPGSTATTGAPPPELNSFSDANEAIKAALAAGNL